MAEVIWLDEAKDDVRAILEYLEAVDPKAAARYVAGIEDTVGRLVTFPQSGRHYGTQFRCLVFRNHLIFYHFHEVADKAEIAAVMDGRRDLTEMIGQLD